jgi:acyl carrier protein
MTTLTDIAGLIQEVIGEDWDLDEEITLETSFSDDLELESIEFVSLAEKMQATFGEEVNFVRWLSEKELDEVIDLKVGDVVEFIDSCKN